MSLVTCPNLLVISICSLCGPKACMDIRPLTSVRGGSISKGKCTDQKVNRINTEICRESETITFSYTPVCLALPFLFVTFNENFSRKLFSQITQQWTDGFDELVIGLRRQILAMNVTKVEVKPRGLIMGALDKLTQFGTKFGGLLSPTLISLGMFVVDSILHLQTPQSQSTDS